MSLNTRRLCGILQTCELSSTQTQLKLKLSIARSAKPHKQPLALVIEEVILNALEGLKRVPL